MTAEAQRLFDEFRHEIWAHRNWDSEFTPSPYEPGGKLRELVDGAGPAAVPLLLDALAGERELRSWACVGLGWLGPAAGEAAVAALTEHVSARRDPLATAAVALDAIAPERASALGVHRWPETMKELTGRQLELGTGAAVRYVERFVAEQADEDVVRFLDQHRLRDWMSHDCPAPVADLLRALLHGDRGAGVRRAAAELVALAGVEPVTEELIDALCHGDPLSEKIVERVAAHPASERLVPGLVRVPGTANSIAALVTRRHCAGLTTDPEPLRAYLRDCVESPTGRWPGPRYGDAVPIAIAHSRDETMLAYLLPMLRGNRLAAHEWSAVVRAFASFGAYGRTLLERDRQRHPDAKQLGWALDAIGGYRPLDQRLRDVDDLFLRGRIETSLGGAFLGYGDVLLHEPSAHAAFQLAWIDRAFGAPVTAARVDWIRALGFTDEPFLAELAGPVERPLDGYRFEWDVGETFHRDRARADRAADAGLPSLAAKWYRDEAYDRAAHAHLERVRQATTSY